jgi:biopolymer transport protein ExbB
VVERRLDRAQKITIDAGAAGVTSPIGTVAVLVRLHDANFQFAAAKSDGSDLRFVAADDKTPLAFHLEKFDSLLNEAFVWVKVPDLKPGAPATIWLYYGNGGKSAARADDVKGTYDSDTVLVYHFTERGQPPVDASASGLNAQNAGASADGAMIGLGLRLDGHSIVTIPASPALAWNDGAAFTWSAWVKFGAPQPNAVVFSRVTGTGAFVIGVNNNFPFFEVTNASGSQRSQPAQLAVAVGWRHVAVVGTGRTITLYVDGEALRLARRTDASIDWFGVRRRRLRRWRGRRRARRRKFRGRDRRAANRASGAVRRLHQVRRGPSGRREGRQGDRVR